MGAGLVRARYLVYFQYLGTDFNGVAAVRGAQHAIGVQNYLEEAAERLNSVVPVKFTISSRTDAGVHALSNAAHLDVQRRSGLPPFSPEVLMEALNTHLRHPAIRVLQAFRVPSHFHARHAATSRTYLYRLVTGCRRPDQLPVFERNRCWALRADCLDVAAMREAAQHLLGTHDFRAFQSAGSPATSPVRTLRRASVSPDPAGSPFVLPEESRSCLYVPSESTARRSQVTPDTQQGQGSRGTLGPAAGRSQLCTPPCITHGPRQAPASCQPGPAASPRLPGWAARGGAQETSASTGKRDTQTARGGFYWKSTPREPHPHLLGAQEQK
ncbi:tRNA pseudouridine synthase-like 1 isoform X5 [Balaenoptera musculus]|uniref:tRNA pseudouridine synthase n=1 Tax=Balaenoptera musculus TaxID=9771 RepID=A0A8B8WUY2_BALMU|nr:tRNA pseudouridine synthase-like 1 isoform X5 [Balaenoptera musculus]